MSSWSSYPKIFAMGHKAIADLLKYQLNVEEKIDGSQFSFGLLPVDPEDNIYSPDPNGLALKVRSKGAIMHIDAPEGLFKEACETVKTLGPDLHPGWTYRGEVLKRPKHNSLAYDRVPAGHIILFDVNTGDQEYLSYEQKAQEAARLGLEVVPLLSQGLIGSIESFRSFLDTVSCLGGQKIEGVVVKPTAYNLYGLDGKALFGKFVSEAFKEVHRKAWGESNPSNKDIISRITDEFTTAARWHKARIHLAEEGKLESSVRDIGLLIKAVPEDVKSECEDEIKEKLFAYAWPHIRRGLTRGLAAWYKDELLKLQFEEPHGGTPRVVRNQEEVINAGQSSGTEA